MSSALPPTKKNITKPVLGLAKKQRLKTPEDFQTVYKSKQWGGSRHYTFNVLADGGQTQLGVTVSKKVSKLAVDRNRIKRQIKEFFRHHQTQLSNAKLVITAKPSCKNASDAERRSSLEELWVKVLKWQRWHARQNKPQADNAS